ncbi:putative benzoate 4-monooxygenase [Phaeomoniella chlamydospora]|uniref:Putative benzoate 4-monooxygenase n=1 Tax=Phaeomoniella chlamydospora TaxID=158046 RepID=A0A0G2GNS7_PHACM|nr:putative benzoate 4-monooxygenase [Phaeomoniella chlamydospora]
MVDFEPYITNAIRTAAGQFDALIETGRAGKCTDLRTEARIEGERKEEGGDAVLDAAKWNAYLAFDIIGDLAFGRSFGFCEAGWDTNGGIRKLRDRGEWAATVGQIPWIKSEFFSVDMLFSVTIPSLHHSNPNVVLRIDNAPSAWTPYFIFDPFFIHGLQAAQALGRIGIAAVDRRKSSPQDPNRKDILYWLLKAKDPDTGLPLPDREVKAEALTEMIAGSDTTGNTLTHIVDMLCRHPAALKNLQKELDTAFPAPLPQSKSVAPFNQCKGLLYVQAVIYETLRLRTTVSVGLPRVVKEGGAEVCGKWLEEGTVVSTPTYTVHRDERIWGKDALQFRPERWIITDDGKLRFHSELEKFFLGFSYGPRACIGRNVAFMELKKTVSTLFRRFDYRLVYPEMETWIREGFHLKCQELFVVIRKRE